MVGSEPGDSFVEQLDLPGSPPMRARYPSCVSADEFELVILPSSSNARAAWSSRAIAADDV